MNSGVILCSVYTVNLRRLEKTVSDEVNAHHICVKCGRQFIDVYSPPKGYSNEVKQECLEVKQECLKAYVNGMGLRAIERDKGVHHKTVIYWLKQIGKQLPDAPPTREIPSVGEFDELETFVGSKKTKFGYGQR